MNKKRKIPKFKSLEKEADFWETHSLADYWSGFKDIGLLVDFQKSRSNPS